MTDPTPSTPTSTMKEAERLVEELCSAVADVETATHMHSADRASLRETAARAALLAFIRSLVEAQPCAVAGEAVPIAVLRDHWLRALECDHEGKRDKPHCACCAVDLGWHPTVGRAVEAWLEHVASVGLPLKGEVPKCPKCNGTGRVPSEDPHPAANAQFDRRCDDCSGTGEAAGEGAAAPSVEPTFEELHAKAMQNPGVADLCRMLAAAPVETEQPTEAMQLAGAQAIRFDTTPLNKLWTANAVWKAMLAARPTPAAGVPPGFVMVPSEPTPEMIYMMTRATANWTERVDSYRNMLAVAPAASPGGVPTGLSDEPPQQFMDYITANYRGEVFFSDPAWHAKRIWRAVRAALSAGAPSSLQGERNGN